MPKTDVMPCPCDRQRRVFWTCAAGLSGQQQPLRISKGKKGLRMENWKWRNWAQERIGSPSPPSPGSTLTINPKSSSQVKMLVSPNFHHHINGTLVDNLTSFMVINTRPGQTTHPSSSLTPRSKSWKSREKASEPGSLAAWPKHPSDLIVIFSSLNDIHFLTALKQNG